MTLLVARVEGKQHQCSLRDSSFLFVFFSQLVTMRTRLKVVSARESLRAAQLQQSAPQLLTQQEQRALLRNGRLAVRFR